MIVTPECGAILTHVRGPRTSSLTKGTSGLLLGSIAYTPKKIPEFPQQDRSYSIHFVHNAAQKLVLFASTISCRSFLKAVLVPSLSVVSVFCTVLCDKHETFH